MDIDKNSFVSSINGLNCTTKSEALEEIAKAFSFPEYNGKNLDALYDCLTDLSWLQYDKIHFVINNQDDFLKNETNETKTNFLELLNDVEEEWKKSDEEDVKEFNLLLTSAN